MKNELDIILANQHSIIWFTRTKIEILNFIYEEYQANNRAVVKHDFLLFSAHIYYRSIIIDLCALFVNRRTEKNNFHLIYQNKAIHQHLSPHTTTEVAAMIVRHTDEINTLQHLRDQEYAHYDFRQPSVQHFSLQHMKTLNNLFSTAVDLLKVCEHGKINGNSAEYFVEINDSLASLKKLIAQ